MRRDALVPAENMGAGRSEQEISLTAGAILLRSCSRWRRTRPRCSPPCWATGALSPVDPLEAGAGVSLTVTPLTPPARPLPSVGEWLTLHEARRDQQR